MRKGFVGVQNVKALERAPKIVLADKSVPAGRYAEAFLAKAAEKFGKPWLHSVMSHVVSRELDVRAVLAKVRLGEADAGVVYISDATSALNDVRTLPIPETMNPLAKYPVALTKSPPNKDGATGFLKYLFTNEAQGILATSGFISPLQPVDAITIVGRPGQRSLKLPLPGGIRDETIEAALHDGTAKKFTGKPVALVLKGLRGKVQITGADDYAQTFDARDLAHGKAVFVRDAGGNYGIVVKGFTPDSWVKWIRRIDLK
jgi:molybdate transport system substrate-binding protein